MGRFIQSAKIETITTIALTEDELGALDALAGYDIEPFLEVFYEHMGRHYMEPHEKGLRTLFETIRKEVPGILSRARDARAAFIDRPKPPAPTHLPESGVRTKGG